MALPSQTDADGARISVTMMVFPSVEMAVAYCEQMEVYVLEGGTLRLDLRWHTSRNDLDDSRLTGKGGAVRSDPSTLLIRYGDVLYQISAGSFNPKYSEAAGLLGKVWLEKVSRAPAGTVSFEGSTPIEGAVITKPDATGAPKGTAPTTKQVIFKDTFDRENVRKGVINFSNFSQWVVKEGSVDLIGNGFYDVLPGRGLYVDLDGSTYKEMMITVSSTTSVKLCFKHSGGDNEGLLLDNVRLERVSSSDETVTGRSEDTSEMPAGSGKPKGYHLSGGKSSLPLGTPYKASDGFLRLELRFSKPGSVLDTVGINSAKDRDFAIWILPDNFLVWQIYHPGIASSVRAPNGWHILRSQGKLQPERWYSVEVTWGRRGARLVIDGKVHAQVDVNLSLSGSEIFLGDFPGDA